MADRRKSRVKPFPLTVGNNPDLWRYESMHDALAKCIDPIATLIRQGQELQANSDPVEAEAKRSASLAAR
jgi:hypothetical protein